jgi:hypothetical protein
LVSTSSEGWRILWKPFRPKFTDKTCKCKNVWIYFEIFI